MVHSTLYNAVSENTNSFLWENSWIYHSWTGFNALCATEENANEKKLSCWAHKWLLIYGWCFFFYSPEEKKKRIKWKKKNKKTRIPSRVCCPHTFNRDGKMSSQTDRQTDNFGQSKMINIYINVYHHRNVYYLYLSFNEIIVESFFSYSLGRLCSF